MKLQNKRTGEIVELLGIVCIDGRTFFRFDDGKAIFKFEANSLFKLNNEWKDVEPTEPLIKDEKIRKAVRAWWETIPDTIIDKRIIYKNNDDFAVGIYTIYCGTIYPETIERNKLYTITELCGEEE